MGHMLAALLSLQKIESKLAQVRSRLRTRERAVKVQQSKINQLCRQWQELHDRHLAKRSHADELALIVQERDEQVAKLRTTLNTAKTNKEYAAILTQINTTKADNSRVEEDALTAMQQAEEIKAEAETLKQQIDSETQVLSEVERTSQAEIARLQEMLDELQANRDHAAKEVPAESLAAFNRIAGNYDGEAMAVIEVHGKKPPFDYTCGGCFMGLNAEHVNALRKYDQVRTCDNCGRILYLDMEIDTAKA